MSAMAELAAILEKAIGPNDKVQEVSSWINTGYPPLNEILTNDAINGGIPFGRIVEIYGPSSSGKTVLATLLMIEAQKMGGCAMFLDHEGTFEVGKAVKMGLNVDFPYWIYRRPDTWEESNTLAMKASEAIRKSKKIPESAPIICVFDSVASMIPKSVFEKGIDEYTMNDTTALARVTSTTLKAVNQFTGKMNATMVYLNQIRTKPGVVYGDPTCLRGDVMVPFVDGTTMCIKDIVEQRIEKEVWSYNEETKSFEQKKIVGWFDNGRLPKDQQWIHIRANGIDTRNGVFGATVTGDHRFFTRDGWIAARDISLSTELLTKQRTVINGEARELVLAMLAGDCTIRKMGANRNTAQLVFQDNNDPEYMNWKAEKLAPILGGFKSIPVKWKDNEGVRMDSPFSAELADLLPLNRNPLELFKQCFTPFALAVWIMDDGHLSNQDGRMRYTVSIKRKKNEEYLDDLADLLFDRIGLRSRVRSREGALIFDADSSRKIAEMIAPFVPNCMQRKLPEEVRNRNYDFIVQPKVVFEEKWVRVTDIRTGSEHRGSHRYDVTVEGNHNYLVGNAANGVLVHNCTPGGGAMEFYASIRLSLGRKRLMEEVDGEKRMVGQIIAIKTQKNKINRPFQECDLRLSFGEDGGMYFDFTASLVEYLIEKGKIAYTKPRATWIDGKQYYVKALIKHIADTGQEAELKKLLAS